MPLRLVALLGPVSITTYPHHANLTGIAGLSAYLLQSWTMQRDLAQLLTWPGAAMAMPAWRLGLSCLTLRCSWLSPAAHKHVSTMTIIMAVLRFASLGPR